MGYLSGHSHLVAIARSRKGLQPSMLSNFMNVVDVRSGSKADLKQRKLNVHSSLNSGHSRRRRLCPFCAAGLMHRSKQHLFLITLSAREIIVGGTS
jgi:hypothetical protein